MKRDTYRLHALALCAALAGCTPTLADREAEATRSVKAQIDGDLAELHSAALELQSAAPAADADGWSASADPESVARLRAAWRRARAAYERIEGAIAVLFPDQDTSIDARYDAFIAERPDENLFDGEGVTGMHAIERILWADAHPAAVVAFESGLAGYRAAAFPANEAEARAFREGLAQRLVDDAARMQREFRPLALDPAAAFRGVIGSLEEQREKVNLAATAEEESRYARFTLADMRANLAGGRRTFAAFRPWLVALGRESLAAAIESRFDAIESRYNALGGDSVPPVPAGWNPDAPSPADAMTEYGQLYALLADEADPARAGSLVHAMGEAADAMGIPRLPE